VSGTFPWKHKIFRKKVKKAIIKGVCYYYYYYYYIPF
jgi:hypothetical protein